jgi:hypothetical protein
MSLLEAAIPVHHGQMDEGLARALIGGIWGFPPGPPVDTSELLEFYVSQIIPLRGDEPAVRTNQHVVNLVNFVRDRLCKPLNEVEAELKAQRPAWLGPSSKAPMAAINLAIRLAFMVKARRLPDKDQAIETTLKGLFPQSTASDSGQCLDHHFNELSLRKVGFKIVRTSYLSEHLSLDQPSRTIRLFAHASFLISCPNDGPR